MVHAVAVLSMEPHMKTSYRGSRPPTCSLHMGGRSWDRSIATPAPEQERRFNSTHEYRRMEVQVHGEFHEVRIRIRGKRSVRMLVNAWDDLPRQVQRNWKKYRRTQYKVKTLLPCVPLHDD